MNTHEEDHGFANALASATTTAPADCTSAASQPDEWAKELIPDDVMRDVIDRGGIDILAPRPGRMNILGLDTRGSPGPWRAATLPEIMALPSKWLQANALTEADIWAEDGPDARALILSLADEGVPGCLLQLRLYQRPDPQPKRKETKSSVRLNRGPVLRDEADLFKAFAEGEPKAE